MAKIKSQNVRTSSSKNILIGILMVAIFGIAIAGVLYAYKLQQQEVEIVAFSKDVSIGTIITESDIKKVSILRQQYDNASEATWTDTNGEQHTEQLYILWDDRAKKDVGCIDKYLTNTGRSNDYLTNRDLSADKVEANPWYAKVEEGSEIYTLGLDLSDTYTRLLMPGATVRMRIITEVDASQASEYRAQIANKAGGAAEGLEDGNGYMSAVLPFYSAKGKDGEADIPTVPIAEVVFENLQIIDALNESGESIFDIFYTLNSMDSTAREEYIRANAEALKTRVIPAKLVLILDADQASEVSEFESLDLDSVKFTIVKNTSDEDLYARFNQIATRISQIQVNTSEEG